MRDNSSYVQIPTVSAGICARDRPFSAPDSSLALRADHSNNVRRICTLRSFLQVFRGLVGGPSKIRIENFDLGD